MVRGWGSTKTLGLLIELFQQLRTPVRNDFLRVFERRHRPSACQPITPEAAVRRPGGIASPRSASQGGPQTCTLSHSRAGRDRVPAIRIPRRHTRIHALPVESVATQASPIDCIDFQPYYNNIIFMSYIIRLPERRAPPHQPILECHNRPNIVFLTVCTANRRRTLANWRFYNHICKAWMKADLWLVGRFIILPDHIHLFCAPSDAVYPALKNWVSLWKRYVTIAYRPECLSFRWQTNFWDTQLRSGGSYESKWQYVRENPVRHGYVSRAEEWPFSGTLNEFIW
jgi:putative transposase